MFNRAFLWSGAALVAVALAWWVLGSRLDDGASAPETGRVVSTQDATFKGAPRTPGRPPEDGERTVTVTDSMGLTLDASRLFELGFGGGLVIDADTRSALETAINALPPEPSEADLDRLHRTLRGGLPFEEAEKAFKLVTGYRAYTREVQRDMMPLGIPANRDEAKIFFDQMDAVRRRHFDAGTADALFGGEDRYARAAMEASFIEQDTTLTAAQKKDAIDALRAQLPADKRELIALPEPVASQPGS